MELKLKQTGDINTFEIKVVGKDAANNPGEAEKNQNAIKELLAGGKRKKLMLFVSHKSGDHILSPFNTLEELKEELMQTVNSIKENSANVDEREIEEDYNNNVYAVENANGHGYYAEFSDSTWFDIFEVEV